MDWIKKNYDRCALIVFALVLVASLGMVFVKIGALPEALADVEKDVTKGTKLTEADTSFLDKTKEAITTPPVWKLNHPGSLFVSHRYLVIDGKLQDPLEGGAMLHAPVPNQWLTDNNLDLLNPDILNEDPDGDGFTVLDEFLGGSDPNDKGSRPSYSTKLRLKRYVRKPFRLKFAAYDGDSFQINTLDIRQPSQFLPLGADIEGTKFKVLKFEKKVTVDENEMEKDLSELTVQNKETGEEVVLIYNKVVDSPDSYALFNFLWDNSEFYVKKDQTFALKPEPKNLYKLIDITDQQAVITNLESGSRVVVPALK